MHRSNLWILILAAAALSLACAETEESTTPDGPTEDVACGVIDCSVIEDETADNYDVDSLVIDPEAGKADAVDRVLGVVADATADGELSIDDARDIFDAAGGRTSVGEAAAIRDAIFGEELPYTVTAEAEAEAYNLARVINISNPEEVSEILSNVAFSGTPVPENVQRLVAMARLNGAEAYDVTEKDEDGEGTWTSYPSLSPATHNMAFDYTEILPVRLDADMADTTVEYNVIVGTETGTTSWGQEYKRAKYEYGQGGTGTVATHYDEVYHHDIFARGSHRQKWASNLAILSDGTLHALPAARRDVNQRVILTNPALARGKRLLWNGHITILQGTVTDVELSGRLSRLAAKGKARFVDPIELMEAWGYDIEDGLRIRWGNTRDGVPVQHAGVVMSEDDVPVETTDTTDTTGN